MGDYYFFFNTIYIMGETPEEWKNSIVIAIFMKGGKQKVENYSWKVIVYLMSFIKYDKFSMKIERTSKTVPFGLPEWILKRQMLH